MKYDEKRRECSEGARLWMAGPRVQASSWVGVGDAERSAVVPLVLHRDPATVRFGIREECGWVQALIVHHRFAESFVCIVVTAAQRAHGADGFSGHRGSSTAKHHRVPRTAAAGAYLGVHRLVRLLLGHGGGWATARK